MRHVELLVAAVAVLPAATAPAAEPPAPVAGIDKLPANQWVALATKPEPGYRFSQPIYVPGRGQVLHWGGIARSDYRPWFRNDVRAFDPDRCEWLSDYPPAEKLPSLMNPPHGKGVWYTGVAEMLECGTPTPSAIANGVCYDSKRDQVIYTMKGLMAAYDPKTRKWRDMEAKTVLDGKEHPGGPPVYGVGTCYDPVNDEILLFPHWGGDNLDMVAVNGRASAHWGTFRYRFDENTWRRVGNTFGSAAIRQERETVMGELAAASRKADEAWAQGRKPGDLKTIKELEQALDGRLRVEPPARTGTPLVYHPKLEAVVMFGGQDGIVRTDLGPDQRPGRLNDTWLYDCKDRQWRRLECKRRPPPTLWPKVVYDPESNRILLVRRTGGWGEDPSISVWALEVERAEWSLLHEQPWPWEMATSGSQGWRNSLHEVALLPDRNVLLLTQVLRPDHDRWVQETYAFQFDVDKLKPQPAPEWTPPPPVQPQVVPPDDPQWVEKLESLPANTWTDAEPPRQPASRGWGVAACDPVRGLVAYFGGGHSSYQVNDVAVYAVGANRWVHTAGDVNDWVPPVGWGGVAMGLHGGPHAHHQRNTYVALDGRVFRSIGSGSRRWSPEAEKQPGPRYAWFWDIDRGGVWRMQKIEKVTLGDGVPGTWGQPHLVHPDGKVYGFGGALEPYDGRFFPDELYFNIYDIYANTLEVKKVPPPHPAPVLEYRPFCTIPERNQIFFYEYREGHGHATWVYDVAKNRFTDLKPKRQPPDQVGTVLYLPEQDTVFAPAGREEQWVYSFRHNTWAPLPVEGKQVRFDPVYAQTVFVAEYGVLVNLPKTELMRPDLDDVKWD